MPGCLGPTPGMERRVDALPQAERGDLQGRHRHHRKTDPDNCSIPPTIYLGALTGIGGGPFTILGLQYHIVRGPQLRHQPIPEPAQSAGI